MPTWILVAVVAVITIFGTIVSAVVAGVTALMIHHKASNVISIAVFIYGLLVTVYISYDAYKKLQYEDQREEYIITVNGKMYSCTKNKKADTLWCERAKKKEKPKETKENK
ncbi:MAG: hypothetical protein WC045_00710 [Patescibacteria group bacterium]